MSGAERAADQRVALVTGGNRGIGLEVCRQLARAGLRVILSSRDLARGRDATRILAQEGLHVSVEQLDVADPESVRACAQRLEEAGVHVDVLVNNAGVYPTAGILRVDEAAAEEALQVNLLGALRTCQAFVPGMVARGYGRVVNVSSGGGSITESVPGPGAYGFSKAGLNALTRMVAHAVRANVKVNAACPGWVATDMGGRGAPRTPSRGPTRSCGWPRCRRTVRPTGSSATVDRSPGRYRCRWGVRRPAGAAVASQRQKHLVAWVRWEKPNSRQLPPTRSDRYQQFRGR